MTHVTTFRKAKDTLKKKKIDLILTEYTFSGGSADQVQAYVAQHYPDTGVVVISHHADQAATAGLLRSGIYDYLVKPDLNEQSLYQFISNSLEKCRLKKEVKLARERLSKISSRDAMTGLFNRAYFNEALEREISGIKRYGNKLAVCIMEIEPSPPAENDWDHRNIKLFQAVSDLLVNGMRNCDIPCIYERSQFAVIMPGTDIDGAKPLMKRLVDNIGATEINIADTTLKASICAGVACVKELKEPSARKLVRQAKRALEYSKNRGKNQVEGFVPSSG